MRTAESYDPHSPFIEYVDNGWVLTGIEPGTKGPRTKGWNERSNGITDPNQAGRLAGAGLLHVYSGTCALDVDDYEAAKAWLATRGVDLDKLLLAEDAVQIRSGVSNRAKLLYALGEPLRSVVIKDVAGAVLFELRCGAGGGRSVQDVLPPSLHPSGNRYAWGGNGSWDALPPLPKTLLEIWRELLKPDIDAKPDGGAPAKPGAAVVLSKQQLQALREALFFLSTESYFDWIGIGLAMAELGDQGRALWMAWSATSKQFDPAKAAEKWPTFAGSRSHWQRVLKIAMRRGWVNAGAGMTRRWEPPPASEDRPSGVEVEPDLLIPLGMTVPEIPATLLPGWLGDMAAAVSLSTQTPPEASVMGVLGMLATCCQRRWEVEVRPGYVEPLSLWAMTVMPSGSRKSAVLEALKSPLCIWEKLQRERVRKEQVRVEAEIAVAEKVIEGLKKSAGKAPDEDSRKKIAEDIEKVLQKMPERVIAPRLSTSNITPERLEMLLAEHDERSAVISDEAGIFSVMAGAYSGGSASLDVFLQSFSGMPLRVDRGGRCAHIDRPALSFAVSLQNGVLADLGRNKRFRDSGLLARFLFAVPRSNVGSRDVRRHDPVPDATRKRYEENMMRLIDRRNDEAGCEVLRLSPEALEHWLCFAEAVEQRMGAGGSLEHLAESLSKLPGIAARIAALLHLAMQVEVALDDPVIGAEAMQRATKLAELSIGHANAAFGAMGRSAPEEDGEAVVRWLRAGRREEFSAREVQRALHGRFSRSEQVISAVGVLQEWGVIVGKYLQKSEGGGRPRELFRVNPRLHRPSAT